MNDVKFKLVPGHASGRDWMAPSPLRQLFWNVTYACNFACGICFTNSARRADDELTTDESKAMLRNARASGVTEIVISGGEPFLREDLFEIIAAMADLGIVARIATNGSLLTDDLLRRLKNETLTRSFQVSLDTLDRDVYRAIHNTPPEGLDRALASLRLIKAHGFHTTVSARLTPATLPGLPALLDRGAAEGWHTVTVHCPLLTGRAEGAWPADTDLLDQLRPVFEHFITSPTHWVVETNIPWAPYHPAIRALEGRVPLYHDGCGAGRWRLSIQPAGWIALCICADLPGMYLGNVRTHNLREVFENSPTADMMRRPADHGICAECPEVARCGGGCRAAAYARTGNLTAPDDSCPLRRRIQQPAVPADVRG